MWPTSQCIGMIAIRLPHVYALEVIEDKISSYEITFYYVHLSLMDHVVWPALVFSRCWFRGGKTPSPGDIYHSHRFISCCFTAVITLIQEHVEVFQVWNQQEPLFAAKVLLSWQHSGDHRNTSSLIGFLPLPGSWVPFDLAPLLWTPVPKIYGCQWNRNDLQGGLG